MKSRVWCFVIGIFMCGQVAWGADRVKLDLMGEWDNGTMSGPTAMCQDAGMVYYWATDGFSVIDVSDPSNLSRIGHLDDLDEAHNDVAIGSGEPKCAYLGGDGGLYIVEVADAHNPHLIGTYSTASRVANVATPNSGIVCLVTGGSLEILDVSAPSSPVRRQLYASSHGYAEHLTQEDSTLFLLVGRTLEILQAPTHTSDLLLTGAYPLRYGKTYSPRTLSFLNGYAWISYTGMGPAGGIQIVDVSDPSAPNEVAWFDFPWRPPLPVAMIGTWAFTHSLTVLDVSMVTQPITIGTGEGEGCADLFVLNGGALVTAGGGRVQTYRITELPAITRQSVQNGKLNLQWNEPARGMKLQRATSLEDPDWQDMQGSEGMQSVEMPLWGGQEYFRLAYDGPENMVWIEPGTFMMGSPGTEQDRQENDGPQTEVTLTQGYFIGKYEVTQEEYLEVMGENPSWFNGVRWDTTDYGVDLNRPVENVTWDDAVAYCETLTAQQLAANQIPVGYAYRLPTEAEWEYACRAGTTTRFSYGDDPDYSELTDYAWYGDHSDGMTHPVGRKLPNPWGLYDMHGNVYERCQDFFSYSLVGGSVVDPVGPATGLDHEFEPHVIRGGDWLSGSFLCRSAYRSYFRYPAFAMNFFGFRVVLAPARP